MRRSAVLFVLAVILGALAVAAASGSTPLRAKVQLHSTSLGKVLADARGHTLYLFKKDKSAKSTCYASCASVWPPFLTSSTPLAGAGVKKALIATSKRKDGKLQVVYAGHPLYYFASDTKAGQASGEDVNDFFVVSAAGKQVKPASSSAGGGGAYGGGATTTTDNSGGKGSNYP